MIHFCTCTGGSAASLRNFIHQEGSKSCKTCGGKLSVDGRGALSEGMPSTQEPELSRAIDPHLNWKMSPGGRQRAVRRARTSFTGGIKKNSTAKCSKASVDLSDKDLKSSSGDMSVSESEKLGVTILGRRFSDTLESVPIKKRRFLLVQSPSPPPQSSPHSSDSDQIRICQSNSYGESDPLDINPVIKRESGQSTDEKTNLKDLNGKLCDNADFSGISILAAVAVMNAEGSVSKDRFSHGEVSRCAESHEDQIHRKEDLDGEIDIPLEVSTALVLPGNESVGAKLDGPLDNPTSSLKNIRNCDDRLCWDLNTVMDAWGSHYDGVVNPKPPPAANITGEVDVHDENLGNMEHDQDQTQFGNTNCASELANSIDLGDLCEDHCALKDTKMQEKPDVCGDSSTADHKEGKDCSSLLHGDGLVDAAVKIMLLHKQENNSLTAEVVSSPTSGTLVSLRDSSIVTAAFKEEKTAVCCVSSGSLVETKLSSSPLVPCENASFDCDHACKQDTVTDQTTEAPIVDLEDRLAHRCHTDVQMVQAAHLRSPQAEKHVSLCDNSVSDEADRCSTASIIAEKASDVMVDGNICKMMNIAGLSGEWERTDALDGTDCVYADKLTKGSTSPFLFDSHSFNSQVLSKHDELPSGGACAGEHEMPDADMKKMQDNQCSVLSDETFNSNGTDCTVHIDSEIPVCNSGHMKPYIVDAPPLDRALNSHGASKSYEDGYAISPGQVVLEDHSECDYYSDASQIDTDQPTGMEKVECLGDDDYQYEDGEFRESVVSAWGEDGTEDGETEHVDYGSDNREVDVFEAACDLPTSVPVHVDGLESKNCGLSDANRSHKFGVQTVKEIQDDVSLPLLKCSSMTNDLDSGSAKRWVKGGINKLEMYAKNDSESGAVNDKGDKDYLNEGDTSRRSSHLSSFRIKSLSGWDLLPEDRRGSGGAVIDSGVDSVSKNRPDASLGVSNARESTRRVVGSPLRRDLPSRVERLESSDVSHIKDKSYVRTSRSNEQNDLHSRVGRDTGVPRSVGRGGSSLYLHGRGRNDRWVESPIRGDTKRLDSHAYYGPSSFTHQASRNAAAAAVAKLESNGFVVGPDGTIIKAGGVAPVCRVPGRSAKASSHSTHHSLMGRRSSIERDGAYGMLLELDNSRETSSDRHISNSRGRAYRYGPRMVSTGHKEGYHRPIRDDSIDTSLPLHGELTRREQSLSPHRRHLRHSRTRSPSRSRTRSPHMYTSPRGRNGSGMNAGLQRLRSPHRRSGLEERMVGYAPSSRNHMSPPHASRWVDERKNLPAHFREHNQFPCRSPPSQVFSRRHRLDPMNSPERVKSNVYSQSMHSGKIPEFSGFNGQSRYGGCVDGRRGHGNRYAMVHCVRQYDTDGQMKHFRYDAEDGFSGHNPQPRSSKFQQRGTPRGFNRSIENQLGDSPRRVKEEKAHVRYVREGKRSASFKSFAVQDCDENITPQRRPS